MKKLTLSVSVFTALILFSCSNEVIVDESLNVDINPNFRVIESNSNQALRESYDDPCMMVDLIAGQNMVAGTVSIDTNQDDLVLKFTTSDGWGIKATHMSIGDCDEQSFPTTGSGNPKIGKFEHSSNHNNNVTEVIYLINKESVSDVYCFAAHAVVEKEGSNETAWAEGMDFGGNSWAMYVETRKSDCDIDNSDVVLK